MRWEYEIVLGHDIANQVSGIPNSFDILKYLTFMGHNGWELVCVEDGKWIFKRPIQ